MYIQLFVIFLFAVGALLFSQNETQGDKNRKRYVIFITLILILQSALRHLGVGADTYAYSLAFEDVKMTEWRDIWQNFYNTYVLEEGKDPGFPLLQKVFQLVFTEYRTFLFAVAIFFFWAFGRFLYQNTHHIRDALVAVSLYEVLFYGFFSVTGVRQTIATAFTLFGYEYCKKRRIIPFVLLILIAGLIHQSALLFLPFYFIMRWKKSRVFLIGAVVSLPLIFPVARNFAMLLAHVSSSDTYMRYAQSDYETQGARMFLVFMVAIALGCIARIRTMLKEDRKNISPVINAFALGLIFTPLTWVDPSLMRVVQYYSIFTVLLLPSMLNAYFPQSRSMRNGLITLVILFFCLIIIRRDAPYAFMWEEMLIVNK